MSLLFFLIGCVEPGQPSFLSELALSLAQTISLISCGLLEMYFAGERAYMKLIAAGSVLTIVLHWQLLDIKHKHSYHQYGF